jgi:hypothetical protein
MTASLEAPALSMWEAAMPRKTWEVPSYCRVSSSLEPREAIVCALMNRNGGLTPTKSLCSSLGDKLRPVGRDTVWLFEVAVRYSRSNVGMQHCGNLVLEGIKMGGAEDAQTAFHFLWLKNSKRDPSIGEHNLRA